MRQGKGTRLQKVLIQEVPLILFLNGRELVTLLCCGHHQDELALGFLRSEGLLSAMEEVESLEVEEKKGVVHVRLRREDILDERPFIKRTLGSGCGRASLYYQPLEAMEIGPIEEESPVRVLAEEVICRMREMVQRAPLYRQTRGTHCAALATPRHLLLMREDIGRHNAVDMIVGHLLREGISARDKILLTTGRASSEIVMKAARAGFPVLISRSAPTDLGVEVACRVGMTLVGSVRGGKMDIYTHPERVMDGE
jgi:FdhD protein